MKNILKSLLLLSFYLLFAIQSVAQTLHTTIIWQITTIDNNEFVGYILSETETTLEFKTATIGIITLQKNRIKRQEQIINHKNANGLLWTENPMAYRYFMGNSGYNLKAKEVYYQNTWIFINNFDIGFTDQFSLGIGTVPLFLFSGSATPIWLTPRYSIPIKADKVNLGIGALAGTILGSDSNITFGFGFGNVTFGNKSQNLTLGVGYGFDDGEFAQRPTFSLAGMTRINKRSYILTENYVISTGFDTTVLLSLGGRFIGKNIILDYGGFFIPNFDVFAISPWLSISLPIGRR